MMSRHIEKEPVRAYLLGKLDRPDADAIEDLYFSDDLAFASVQAIEDELIRDYLDGRLSASDKRLFESRYRSVPQLRTKLDAARAARSARWRLPVAAAVLLALGAVGFYATRRSAPEPPLIARVAPPVSPLEVHLSPGVLKGAAAAPKAPPSGRPLLLILELPGERAAIDASVRILRIEADGARNPVWSSAAPVASKPSETGRTVSAAPPPLAPADYLVEASVAGAVKETYLLRIAPE